MNNKSLAITGMAGAPFLCLGMATEILVPSPYNTQFTGAWGIVYIGAWMCTVLSLHRMGVFQLYRFPRYVSYVLLASLGVANVSNILLAMQGVVNSPLYFYLDLCWPLSNLLMLVLGLSLLGRKGIPKPLRLSILITGTWFPVCVLLMLLLGKIPAVLWFGCVYSLVNWTVLGYLTWRLALREERESSLAPSAAFKAP